VLLSTGWLQERIRAWFHNRTKINWGPYGRLTKMSNNPLVKYRQNQILNTILIDWTYQWCKYHAIYSGKQLYFVNSFWIRVFLWTIWVLAV